MRALQIAACGLGLLAWGLGHWFHVLPWPVSFTVALHDRQGPSGPAAPLRAPHRAGMSHTVTARAGAQTLSVAAVLPPGVPLAGVHVRVLQPFGSTHGLEAVAVGTRTQYARFGRWEGHQWHPGVPGVVVTEDDTAVVLTALGGKFDAHGRLELTVLPLAAPAQQ